MYKKFFKRFFDFWISLIALICISPILLVVTIWLHFANKGAGAFFTQERPGKDGEIFKHSRIPVYEDTIDNIIGIVPIKSIAKAIFRHETIDIRNLMYKPLIIPRNHQLLDLLQEFKQTKIHVAVIIDEYGGTEGIITMEDILEEIVGDIFDETDKVEEEYYINKDGSIGFRSRFRPCYGYRHWKSCFKSN